MNSISVNLDVHFGFGLAAKNFKSSKRTDDRVSIFPRNAGRFLRYLFFRTVKLTSILKQQGTPGGIAVPSLKCLSYVKIKPKNHEKQNCCPYFIFMLLLL